MYLGRKMYCLASLFSCLVAIVEVFISIVLEKKKKKAVDRKFNMYEV